MCLIDFPKVTTTVQSPSEFHNVLNNLRDKILTAQKQPEMAGGKNLFIPLNIQAPVCGTAWKGLVGWPS